jgi:predicted methyltransferase
MRLVITQEFLRFFSQEMHMRHAILGLALTLALAAPLAAQQQPGAGGGPSEGQLAAATAEVPRLVELFELKAGMTIADVGAGFGAWTIGFAEAVGPTGRVYSSDIGEEQLASLRQTMTGRGLTNVTVVEAGERSTNLPAGCCDAILIRDAYHHLTAPGDITSSFAAALKLGGRLVVVDFLPRPNTDVPAGVPANRGGHGVPSDVVIAELTAAGLTHVISDPQWSGTPERPASLFLALFQK